MKKLLFLQLGLLISIIGNCQLKNDPSLIAFYKFNKVHGIDSTIVIDSSHFKNNGKIFGKVIFDSDRFDNPCSALGFDGTTYISVPNSTSLQSPSDALTIAVWFKINNGADFFNQWITICCKSDISQESDSSPQYRMQATAQTISLSSNFVEKVIPQLSYDQWYFYAYTFDGSSVKAYLDGQMFFEKNYSEAFEKNNMPLEIGRDLPGKKENFNGQMDDLRIYNRALSSKEIFSIFIDQSDASAPNRCIIPPSIPNGNPNVQNPNVLATNEPLIAIGEYAGLPEYFESLPIIYQKTIEVKNKNITIYPFDNNKDDQDIVSINLNGQWVMENYNIRPKQKTPPNDILIKATLNQGENNYLISKAINEGKIPPNTLTLLIYDGISEQSIVLDSKIGVSGGIRIVCN